MDIKRDDILEGDVILYRDKTGFTFLADCINGMIRLLDADDTVPHVWLKRIAEGGKSYFIYIKDLPKKVPKVGKMIDNKLVLDPGKYKGKFSGLIK